MQNWHQRIPALLLWLLATFLITFSLPSPSVHSGAFSHAAAAYAQDPSIGNLERLRVEHKRVEDHRAWLLLARWIAAFGLGIAIFGVGKRIFQRQNLRFSR